MCGWGVRAARREGKGIVPTYDFNCSTCGDYEIFTSIKAYTGKEPCPSCGKSGDRVFVRNGMFMGAGVECAEYNPGLGMVVKNKKHREEVCRQRGLVEIGNEKPESLRKSVEKERKSKIAKDYISGKELWQFKDSMRR